VKVEWYCIQFFALLALIEYCTSQFYYKYIKKGRERELVMDI
jgi:hypothetical protein